MIVSRIHQDVLVKMSDADCQAEFEGPVDYVAVEFSCGSEADLHTVQSLIDMRTMFASEPQAAQIRKVADQKDFTYQPWGDDWLCLETFHEGRRNRFVIKSDGEIVQL